MPKSIVLEIPYQQAIFVKAVIDSLIDVPDNLKGPKVFEDQIKGFAIRLQDAMNRG